MDLSLNYTLKDTFYFIHTIQDACDRRRSHVEKHDLQEYDKFMKEWKQRQLKAIKDKPLPKQDTSTSNENLINNQQEHVKTIELTDEIQEIALIDNLLEKARSIRLKNKVPLKNMMDVVKTEDIVCHTERKTLKNVAQTSKSPNISNLCKVRSTKTLFSVNLPRSKSAGSTVRLKVTNVPHSKSVNINHLANGKDCSLKNGISFYTSNSESTDVLSFTQSDHRNSEVQDLAIIPKSELKKISSELTEFNKKFSEKVQDKKNSYPSSKSDFTQDLLHHNRFPTYKTYQNKLKPEISSSKSFFQLYKSYLWYPFLNAKSQKYLIAGQDFTSFPSFTEAIKLLHNIQETMFWIDLLSLLGKETLPMIKVLDGNDWSAIRFCSYIESIYSENLQRFPILDTN